MGLGKWLDEGGIGCRRKEGGAEERMWSGERMWGHTFRGDISQYYAVLLVDLWSVVHEDMEDHFRDSDALKIHETSL